MAEDLLLPETDDRQALYDAVLPQLKAVLEGETDAVAAMANTAAVLKYGLGFFWVGFYVFKDGGLVVGPFQGPPACARIALGRGVCGKAAQDKQTVLVPDVHAFPGHIACSSLSQSEIVVPLLGDGGQLLGVLDVDSDQVNDFSAVDQVALEEVCRWVAGLLV